MKATNAIDYYEDLFGEEPANIRIKKAKKPKSDDSSKSDNKKKNKIDKKNAVKAPWKQSE